MFETHIGEVSALLVALFWTITALSFEYASVRVGSLAVNFIRLVFGLIFLSAYTFFARGMLLPLDADMNAWFWLALSGLIGFVAGDLFLFKAFSVVGARLSMLIMTLVPPVTAIFGWIILGEKLTWLGFTGMTLTIAGIAMALLSRNRNNKKLAVKTPLKGILFALGGAIGQAIGLVLSKFGMGDYDPFAATQIRIIAGIIGFGIIVLLLGRTKNIKNAMKNREGVVGITLGSFFGPFLGVSFSLLAVKYTETGIASTIMAIVPILIIPPSVLLFRQKITMGEIIGAFISVGGVVLFFV
jgi:drug/metabolite transporter (DMT)-like permease